MGIFWITLDRNKIGSILNFEEWIGIANWGSTNLSKTENFISHRPKVMSQILTVFERVFVNFILRRIFFKLSLLMFSIMADQLVILFFTTEQFFFYKNTITSDCTILLSYVLALLTWNTHVIFHKYLWSEATRLGPYVDWIMFLRSVLGIFLTDYTITQFQRWIVICTVDVQYKDA